MADYRVAANVSEVNTIFIKSLSAVVTCIQLLPDFAGAQSEFTEPSLSQQECKPVLMRTVTIVAACVVWNRRGP